MPPVVDEKTRSLPIGVFDSGLGGLTVVREMRLRLPAERIMYLGDSARVPYGTRSASTVEKYAWNCTELLVRKGLKLLVVACNTVSAVALPSLREKIRVPIFGVISAGAISAVRVSKTKRIGVIGTAGTIGSNAYVKEIKALHEDMVVFQNPAPLLVPLAEEGWVEGEVPFLAACRYLEPLVKADIDVLLLGCTHYPLLTGVLKLALRELGSNAQIVDSATAVTLSVESVLEERALANPSYEKAPLKCFVTDLPASFEEVAARFLGEAVMDVEKVDIS